MFSFPGPYFRYRTFLDHLYKPYHKYDDYKSEILRKLYLIPLLGGIHFFTNNYWPISVRNVYLGNIKKY